MIVPDFLGEGTNVALGDARAVVLPVPHEATVSYGTGTARGPEAILQASAQVELWEDALGVEPYRCGIHTAPAFTVPSGDHGQGLVQLRDRVGELMDAGKWVVMLGGEHSITPAAVAAAASRMEGLRVVQLDAHADLRESYEGDPWSHASAMARSLEHAPVTAIGIRSYGTEEARRIEEGIPGYRIVHARELEEDGWIERALDGIDGTPVYLTVDLDYFDPAALPATGTPEPGGGRWWPTRQFLAELFRRADVVGCDVVELAPVAGLHHADFTAARLVHGLIGLRFRDLLTRPGAPT